MKEKFEFNKMNDEFPLVSVIIVNYNGKNLLEDCFESLSKVTYPNFEIILVDNNSNDGSLPFIKKNFPETKIIKLEKNYGFAKPNNLGSKTAQGKYLLFLNNDTKVCPNFLDDLVKTMEEDPKVGVCQSLLLVPDGDIDSSGDFIDSLGIAFSSKQKITEKREILSAKGASMIVRKDLFDHLEGFDEKFFISFEDVDLGWRTWILGYKVLIVPKSIVYHLRGQTINRIKPDMAFHGLKNQLSMKITNFEIKLGFKVFLKFVFVYGFKMLKVLFDYNIKGRTTIQATKYEEKIAQKPNLKAIIKSFGWLISNFVYLNKKQRWLKKNRVNSTSFLLDRKVIIK